MARFNFNIEPQEAIRLATLLTACAESAEKNMLEDPTTASFIIKMQNDLLHQITHKMPHHVMQDAVAYIKKL